MVRRTIVLTFDAIRLTHGADGKLVIGGYTSGQPFDVLLVGYYEGDAPDDQSGEGGSIPTAALQPLS